MGGTAGSGGPCRSLGRLGPLYVGESIFGGLSDLNEPYGATGVVVASQTGTPGLQGRGVRLGVRGREQREPGFSRGLVKRRSFGGAASGPPLSLFVVVSLDALRPWGPAQSSGESALDVPGRLCVGRGLGVLPRADRGAAPRAAAFSRAESVAERCLCGRELVGRRQGLCVRRCARRGERGLEAVARGTQEERGSVDSLREGVEEKGGTS